METIKGVQLNRTVGLELEGYVDENPYNFSVLAMDWHIDESLNYAYYDEDDSQGMYGIEYNTDPIINTSAIDVIYDELHKRGWSVDERAGLHIHVHANDFNIEEKARLLRFTKGIEHIMYAIVEEYRYNNDYCQKIHNGWRHLFRKQLGVEIDWNTLNSLENGEDTFWNSNRHSQYNALTSFINRDSHRNIIHRSVQGLWTGRYQWLNAITSHDTVEFRLFSATDDVETAKRFALIAHNIVEVAKHSSIEQINFIVKSVYQQLTVEDMITSLMTSIGLEGLHVPILNQYVASKIDSKFCAKNRGEGQEVVAV